MYIKKKKKKPALEPNFYHPAGAASPRSSQRPHGCWALSPSQSSFLLPSPASQAPQVNLHQNGRDRAELSLAHTCTHLRLQVPIPPSRWATRISQSALSITLHTHVCRHSQTPGDKDLALVSRCRQNATHTVDLHPRKSAAEGLKCEKAQRREWRLVRRENEM